MIEEKKSWLLTLLDLPDACYGKKGQCHTSKICEKNKYVQKLYLLWNLSDLNQIINESTIVKDETETKERLFKLWTL